MPYPAVAVANKFLQLAKEDRRVLTPMQLLKLVYFAHGWYWAIANKRLIDERVEAWEYGPVVPSVYHEFKRFGNEPITELAGEMVPTRTPDGSLRFVREDYGLHGDDCDLAKRLIRRVWDVYKGFSAIELSRMTHEPGTPWQETPGKDIKGTDIEDSKIREYFLALAQQNAPQRA